MHSWMCVQYTALRRCVHSKLEVDIVLQRTMCSAAVHYDASIHAHFVPLELRLVA
jgi:hypothetical protein